MSHTRLQLSILLPTYNSERIIRRCLESVKWANEILVVDSYSTDRTLEIAREYGARIIQHEYVNSATQKNWAIPQCSNEWVMQMDTDEELEEGAVEEIQDAISRAVPDLQAFRLPRMNYIFHLPAKLPYLYPDYQTRLFRRDVAQFQDKEVHAHTRVPGQVGTLSHHIKHYSMPTITKQLENLNRYSRYQADELRKRGKRFHWYQITLRPLIIFTYLYVWQRGFTAGSRGLLTAAVNTAFDFWAHAKLWEMQELGLSKSPK